MNHILHIECSPRGAASFSSQVARHAVQALLREHPNARVIERSLGDEPPPHMSLGFIGAAFTEPHARTEAQRGLLAYSEALIAELDAADVVVIGTPMHNYTAPSSLKAWIDYVVRVGRTFNVTPQGKVGLLGDRPVLVAIASGGFFSEGERVRQPDYLTGYLRAVFATIGIRNVEFVTVEGMGRDREREAAMLERARHWIDANVGRLARTQAA
ncbi:FMN-dependent NADH-azoreductase [Trinickia dinghuensis]|uniref:FMN dependent NADH:quinone oxidoreductase n=1 Tax=Trinickia dinghuensis TaxID=2291023 RepID=A0A3D8JSL7_9BURK|nr:NAD(P)H-dependent oxidoreductase [Trinickia dinghuensis]RDU96129.1 flavodoxin family protein [Trinickia dinghuensis]